MPASAPAPVRHQGWMLKRKRKRLQGFAKRYFYIDTNGWLSYSMNPNSPVRDRVFIPECHISHSHNRRAIIIDSGHVVMHCRALNEKDFVNWLQLFRSFMGNVNHHHHHKTHRQTSSFGPGSRSFEPTQLGHSSDTNPADHTNAIEKSIDDIRTLYDQLSSSRSDQADQRAKFTSRVFKKDKDKNEMIQIDPEWFKKFGVALHRMETHWDMLSTTGHLSRRASSSTERPPHRSENFSPTLPNYSSSDVSDTTYHDALGGGEADLDAIDSANASDDPDRTDHGSLAPGSSTMEESDLSLGSDDTESLDDDDDEPISTTNTSLDSAAALVKRRTRLPSPIVGNDVGIFGVLKKNMGKNLSQVSMPVTFNEPLSALQRLAEDFEYSVLLNHAAACKDSIDRLSFIAAFIVSGFACTRLRSFKKPFNPLLGETYECVRPDKGFKFIAEKVQHHPPVLASYSTGQDWEAETSTTGHSKFWGRSLEYVTKCSNTVKLKRTGEVFAWDRPSTFVRNIMSGSKYLEHIGPVTLTNLTSGEKAILDFKGQGTFGGAKNKVHGQLVNAQGETIGELVGRWDKSISLKKADDDLKLLWECQDLPNDAEQYYGFTNFAIELNELTSDLVSVIPRTDTRLRPDQLALEVGDADRAEELKQRLEEAQRQRRREFEANDTCPFPRFFECVAKLDDVVHNPSILESNNNSDNNDDNANGINGNTKQHLVPSPEWAGCWKYKGDYFKQRESANFHDDQVPDIYLLSQDLNSSTNNT